MTFPFGLMSQTDAEAIADWHSPEPFSFYDWAADPRDLAELLNPTARGDGYFAVEDEAGELIGFFHYNEPPAARLELGLGLHPDRTVQGLGKSFVEAGLEFGRERFAPREFTLSVASFNRRAIRVYERVGFSTVRVFSHWTNGAEGSSSRWNGPPRNPRAQDSLIDGCLKPARRRQMRSARL